MTRFEEIENVLLFLNSNLRGRVEWAVDGSTSLRLQGIDVEPHDLDILTDKDGAVTASVILKDHVKKSPGYGSTEKYRSHFCILEICKIKVEIMGDLQSYRNGRWTEIQNPRSTGVRYVLLRGKEIPVVPLEYLESTGYYRERMSREEPKR